PAGRDDHRRRRGGRRCRGRRDRGGAGQSGVTNVAATFLVVWTIEHALWSPRPHNPLFATEGGAILLHQREALIRRLNWSLRRRGATANPALTHHRRRA